MTVSTASPAPAGAAGPSFYEFVGLMALLMALTAVAIDVLLPAFQIIGRDFAIEDPNELQYLVYVYMFGFAAMQLVYGPVSDSIGRRPVVIFGILVYLAGCVMAFLAPSFGALVAARAVQGMGSAAARVLTVSIIRDRFGGRDMARVMSFVMMVFIMVPIVAPSLGAVLVALGDWHLVIWAMVALGIASLGWFALRLPETLHPEYRMPLSGARVAAAAARCLTERVTIGYATVMAMLTGCLMGYVGSAQQIFEEAYGLGALFPIAFGVLAFAIGLGSFVNARLVQRVGMRRLTHGALVAATLSAAALLAVAYFSDGRPPLVVFGLLLSVFNVSFALSMPNCNALAMQPLGAVAGTASSLLGFYTTLAGTVVGLVIGQSFDGTVLPLSGGFLVICLASLAVVFVTEKGRLFEAHPPSAGSAT